MNFIRIIPTLLLQDGYLVKTKNFKNPKYIGDPINAVRIFNVKEVDELVLFDISATKKGREPNYKELEEILSEAFMPIGYGGGVNKLQQIEKLFKIGIEKVILNTAAFENEGLIKEASNIYGSQSIVVCLDYKKDLWGDYKFYTKSGSNKINGRCLDIIKKLEDLGAGEVILNSIEKDGTMSGYDLNLVEKLASEVSIPVIASGGAGNIQDFVGAIEAGASAVAAGSMFVFHGIHRAVLISYVNSRELNTALENKTAKNIYNNAK